MSAHFRHPVAGHARQQFIRSFDGLDPADLVDFLDAQVEDDWCEGCGLPLIACCCPEADEFEDLQ